MVTRITCEVNGENELSVCQFLSSTKTLACVHAQTNSKDSMLTGRLKSGAQHQTCAKWSERSPIGNHLLLSPSVTVCFGSPHFCLISKSTCTDTTRTTDFLTSGWLFCALPSAIRQHRLQRGLAAQKAMQAAQAALAQAEGEAKQVRGESVVRLSYFHP